MPFCRQCGASVDGAFCAQCGTAVSAASGQAPPPPPGPSAPRTPPGVAAASGARKTSPLVWVMVVILGLVLLGGLVVGGITMLVVHKAREAGISTDLWKRNPAAATARALALANP